MLAFAGKVSDWQEHKQFCVQTEEQLVSSWTALTVEFHRWNMRGEVEGQGPFKCIEHFMRHIGPRFQDPCNHGTSLHKLSMLWMGLPCGKAQEELSGLVAFAYELGCDVNAQTSFGDSPLHLACVQNTAPMVDFFLEQTPIRIDLKDHDGKTAEECCTTCGRWTVCARHRQLAAATAHAKGVLFVGKSGFRAERNGTERNSGESAGFR